jgi:hypothetical protein
MSDRRTRTMNSRLTGVAANRKRRRSVRHAPEGRFCHAAKREAPSGLPCTRAFLMRPSPKLPAGDPIWLNNLP